MGLLSFLRRPRVIEAVTIRPGADLVLSIPDWNASEDLVGLLRAAEKQFPGVRIHLLAGFLLVEPARKREPGNKQGDGRTDDQRRKPVLPSLLPTSQIETPFPNSPQQGVVVTTYATPGRVVLVLIPPKKKRKAGDPAILQGRPSNE